MTTDSVDEFRTVQQRLQEISDRTYKNIDEQAELYIRSASVMKELGYNTAGTLDFIDSISSSLTINAASAINALSKSMISGKVSGEQWNTVMAVMPTVVADIARYLGSTEQAVKSLAAAGRLSMDTFVRATIAARDRNVELAEQMPTTVSDAFTKLNNHFKTYISEVNSVSGATRTISFSIGYLAEHIDTMVIAAALLGGIALARTFSEWASSSVLETKNLALQTRNQLALTATQREGLAASLTQLITERAMAVMTQQSLVAQLKLAQPEQARLVIRKQLAANSAEVVRLMHAEAAATAQLSAVQSRLSLSSSIVNSGLHRGIRACTVYGLFCWLMLVLS
jgi:tape measure domain-containing protein